MIEKWKNEVGYREEWGQISGCGQFNGSSGLWVDEMILGPMGFSRNEVWITDCLDTYHESNGAQKTLGDGDVLTTVEHLHISPRYHQRHPSEDQIVLRTMSHHLDRLGKELEKCSPKVVVTLGNAALRIMRELIDDSREPPKQLSPDGSYGRPQSVKVGDHSFKWFPLAHPASPESYQVAHQAWAASQP